MVIHKLPRAADPAALSSYPVNTSAMKLSVKN
jgi:hypothetical protein